MKWGIQLQYRGTVFFLQPVGFVTFSDRASAEVAKEELQVRIDDVECDDVTIVDEVILRHA